MFRRGGQFHGRLTPQWATNSSIFGTKLTTAAGVSNYQSIVNIPLISGGAPAGVPPIDAMSVDVVGTVENYPNAAVAGDYYVGIGIYVSDWDASAGNWSGQNPGNPSEAGRENWLYLHMRCFRMNVINQQIIGITPNFPKVNVRGIRVEYAQNLYIVVNNGGGSADSVATFLNLRYRRRVIK